MAPNLPVGRLVWFLVFAVSLFGVISLVFWDLLAIGRGQNYIFEFGSFVHKRFNLGRAIPGSSFK